MTIDHSPESLRMAQASIEWVQERNRDWAIELDDYLAEKFGKPTREQINAALASRPSSTPTPATDEVRSGVCLACGGGVMNDGTHVEPERHQN